MGRMINPKNIKKRKRLCEDLSTFNITSLKIFLLSYIRMFKGTP